MSCVFLTSRTLFLITTRMKIVNATDMRTNFQDVIDEVHYTKNPILVSKRNKPWVIIESLPEDDTDLEQMIANNKSKR